MNNNINNNNQNYNNNPQFTNPFTVPTNPPYPNGAMPNNNPSNINNQVNQLYQTQTLSQEINNPQSMPSNITNYNQNIHNGVVPELKTTNSVNSVPNNNLSYNETSLTDLNIKGNYNNPEQNIHEFTKENINNQKKKTVPISKELKLVIVIALILFVFILVLPNLFDIVMNIKY